MSNLVTLGNVQSVIDKVLEASIPIPFENSEYQTRAFVIAASLTPARAYRSILLRMNSKLQVVKDFQFKQMRTEIDIEEKEAKIADPNTSEFDRRRLRIDLAEIAAARPMNEKLVGDAINELNCLYAELQKYPQFTREQFEAEEAAHFNVRLQRQLKNNGAQESLENMKDLGTFDTLVELAATHLRQLEHKE
jgi:hypothetical protein